MSAAAPAPAAALSPTTRGERSLAPDLARGAVLLFIALANVSQYNFDRPLNLAARPVEGSALDHGLDFVVSLFVDQRSYPMFAMLFGYGMATVLRRGLAKGQSLQAVRRVLLRRNLWLVAFGLVHVALLFFGDILAPYGITGLIVLLLLHRRTRTLVWWAVLTLIPLTLLFATSGLELETEGLFVADSYPASILERLSFAVVGDIAVGVLLVLVGPMLIGVLVSRAGLLDRPWDHTRTLTRIALGGLAVNIVLGLPYALVVGGYWQIESAALGFLLSALHAVSGVACGLAYLCVFGLVAARLRDRGRPGVVGPLAATGERSLTCYLLQSVVFAPLMSAWGVGLGAENSSTENYLLALGVWLFTVVLASLLAAAGRRGPFEVLLRRLTYGRQPAPQRPSLATS